MRIKTDAKQFEMVDEDEPVGTTAGTDQGEEPQAPSTQTREEVNHCSLTDGFLIELRFVYHRNTLCAYNSIVVKTVSCTFMLLMLIT